MITTYPDDSYYNIITKINNKLISILKNIKIDDKTKNQIKNDEKKLTIIKEYCLSVNSPILKLLKEVQIMFLKNLSDAEDSEQNPIIFYYDFFGYLFS
jgi:hypothetical protein